MVLDDKGKLVEAQKTADGYVEKQGGKQYETAKDGLLKEKPAQDGKKGEPQVINTPYLRRRL